MRLKGPVCLSFRQAVCIRIRIGSLLSSGLLNQLIPLIPASSETGSFFIITLHLSLYEEPVSGLYAPKHTDAAGPDTGRGQGGILQGKA